MSIKQKLIDLKDSIKLKAEEATNLVDEVTEETPVEEITVEGLAEMLKELTEEVAGLMVRIEALETPVEEVPVVEELSEVTPETETKEVMKLAAIFEVNKWKIVTENEEFNVGDLVQYKNDWEENGELYNVADGEYELENGDTIQIDSDGIIVLKTPKGEDKIVEETPAEVVEELSEVTPEVDEKDAEIARLKLELAEAKEPVAEPVINKETTELSDSSSYAVKMQARISKQREAMGLSKY